MTDNMLSEAYLLQSHAPHTVLPTPVRTSGTQTEAAVMEIVARWRARHWGRRLHLHWGDVEQGVAKTRPVVGGVHTQDAPRLTLRFHSRQAFFLGKNALNLKSITRVNSKWLYKCLQHNDDYLLHYVWRN